MKSNQINGTNYNTNYKEKQQITISKKERQEKSGIVENSIFNENKINYKSTKIIKENLNYILGEERKT